MLCLGPGAPDRLQSSSVEWVPGLQSLHSDLQQGIRRQKTIYTGLVHNYIYNTGYTNRILKHINQCTHTAPPFQNRIIPLRTNGKLTLIINKQQTSRTLTRGGALRLYSSENYSTGVTLTTSWPGTRYYVLRFDIAPQPPTLRHDWWWSYWWYIWRCN